MSSFINDFTLYFNFRKRLFTLAFVFLLFLTTVDNVLAQTSPIKVSADGHFLEYKGRKVLLIGDSVTQGWMELGSNFNQTDYLNTLSAKGINAVLLWAYIGVVNQVQDARIGYDAPEIWPWKKSGSLFDLSQFNQPYFDRLKSFVSSAEAKGIIVIITVHDGWTKERFSGHPFNQALGGPLAVRDDYVNLGISTNKLRQEAFAQKLISELGAYSNVMFEMFNEGDWYNQTLRNQHEQNFLQYFNSRNNLPLLTNSDHISLDSPRSDTKVDIVSYHDNWTTSTTALTLFNSYAAEFARTPVKPFFSSETVGAYDGDTGDHDALMRVIWGTALGGAGIVVQNDASFGFDSSARISAQKSNLLKMLDIEGYATKFFNQYIDLDGVKPNANICSTGICLAEIGQEYVVYSQSGTSFTVNLSSVSGNFTARFYNPRNGVFNQSSTVAGGATRTFNKPDGNDWVLHLVKTGLTPDPTRVPSTPTPTPVSLPGDANRDGKVDLSDYTIWLTNIWQNNFGAS